MQEPLSERLCKQYEYHGKSQLHCYPRREHLPQPLRITATPDFKRKIAADGSGNGCGYKGEYRNHASNGIVHSIIRFPKSSEHHP